MSYTKRSQLSVPESTHNKLVNLAEHIDCLSETGEPKPTGVLHKAVRLLLGYYSDDKFQKCLDREGGIDTFAYIRKCINNGMNKSLSENEQH